MKNIDIKQITEQYHKSTNENVNSVFYGRKIVDGKLTDELGFIFMVNEKKPLSELNSDEIIPDKIFIDEEGIKTDVLESKPELALYCKYCDPNFYDWQTTPPINNDLYTNVRGGMGLYNIINGAGIGTMGFIAIDNDTDSIVGITNSHVALKDPLVCSERDPRSVIVNHYDNTLHQGYMATPSTIGVYENYVGKVKKYVPLTTLVANQVDGTAIAINYDVFAPGHIWKQVGLDDIVTGCTEFASTEELDDLLNTNPDLYSTGIRTGAKGNGTTLLKPYAINGNLTTTISINYPTQGTTKTLTFNNVHAYIAVDPTDSTSCCFFPANSGDSGSVVLGRIPIGGGEYQIKIIGLLFAVSFITTEYGSLGVIAFFNRIDDVAEQLNIRALDEAFLSGVTQNDLSNLDGLESCVVEGLSNQKYIIKDGKKYWQVGLTTSTDICQPD